MRKRAAPPRATTPRPICCTRRYARCWASTFSRKGPWVAPDRLRFDFSHYEPVTREEIRRIESLVSSWILGNDEACTEIMPLDEAKRSGAVALFGERYDDPVRVLSFGGHSVELCGGTHVRRSGDVGLFKIVSEGGIAAGVRRIVALTGEEALAWVHSMEDRIGRIAGSMKADAETVADRVEAMLVRNRALERDLERLKARIAASRGDDLAAQAVDVDGLKVLAAKIDGADPKALRETVDRLKSRLGSAAVVLATVKAEKVALVAGVTKTTTRIAFEAGMLANHVARQVGRARGWAAGACAGRRQRSVPGGPGDPLCCGMGARTARGGGHPLMRGSSIGSGSGTAPGAPHLRHCGFGRRHTVHCGRSSPSGPHRR